MSCPRDEGAGGISQHPFGAPSKATHVGAAGHDLSLQPQGGWSRSPLMSGRRRVMIDGDSSRGGAGPPRAPHSAPGSRGTTGPVPCFRRPVAARAASYGRRGSREQPSHSEPVWRAILGGRYPVPARLRGAPRSRLTLRPRPGKLFTRWSGTGCAMLDHGRPSFRRPPRALHLLGGHHRGRPRRPPRGQSCREGGLEQRRRSGCRDRPGWPVTDSPLPRRDPGP